MWKQLSGAEKFKVVAAGFSPVLLVPLGIVLVVDGISEGAAARIWMRGVVFVFLGIGLGYAAYKTATSPAIVPRAEDDFFLDFLDPDRLSGRRITPAARVPRQDPPTTSDAPGAKGDETSTKARCHHCGHVQTVPVSQETFSCERCQANLKRRSAPANGG
jgi:hypothetical protein